MQERMALMEEGDVEGLKVVTGVDRDEDPFVHCLTFYTTHGLCWCLVGIFFLLVKMVTNG